jgi:hypothetical protein
VLAATTSARCCSRHRGHDRGAHGFAAMRAVAAAVVMFPVGVLVLGSVVGAALGLILGTAVPVNRINVIFAIG